MFQLIVSMVLLVPVVPTVELPAPAILAPAKWQNFVFRVKTKDGNIVGNITIHARDQFEAQSKLQLKYPGCTILRMEVKP